MDYKAEYKRIGEQIIDLQQKRHEILVQAVEAKGLKVGTVFKIHNLWSYENKLFKVADELNFYQLTKKGKINRAVSYMRFNFTLLDKVEIVEQGSSSI